LFRQNGGFKEVPKNKSKKVSKKNEAACGLSTKGKKQEVRHRRESEAQRAFADESSQVKSS
jgi:hypothetical protein